MIQLRLKNIAVVISLILVLIILIQPISNSEIVKGIALFLFVFLGIPHGATDHILYKFLNKENEKSHFISFLFKYILLSVSFYLIWHLLPWLALTIFLVVSGYHFGQANWNKLNVNKFLKNLIYFFWGGFVLTGSLLWNFNETQPIVESLIGFELNFSDSFVNYTPIIFFLSTAVAASLFFLRKHLSAKEFLTEIISLVALTFLFTTAPLLVGFSCFFVLWHSTVSIADQIEAFQKKNKNFSFKEYLYLAMPLSLVVFVFLGTAFYFTGSEQITNSVVGAFFKFISIITLPHTFLMDRLLENTEKTSQQVRFKIPQLPKDIFPEKRNVKQF